MNVNAFSKVFEMQCKLPAPGYTGRAGTFLGGTWICLSVCLSVEIVIWPLLRQKVSDLVYERPKCSSSVPLAPR